MNVFISHVQSDKKWADALRSGLEQEGFKVWGAASELSPGDNWHLEIGKALERSDAMVVVISPDSAASPAVRAEIEYALSSSQFRDRLIPIQVKPTEDIPWILRRQQFIRATRNMDETVHRVAAVLQKVPLAA